MQTETVLFSATVTEGGCEMKKKANCVTLSGKKLFFFPKQNRADDFAMIVYLMET